MKMSSMCNKFWSYYWTLWEKSTWLSDANLFSKDGTGIFIIVSPNDTLLPLEWIYNFSLSTSYSSCFLYVVSVSRSFSRFLIFNSIWYIFFGSMSDVMPSVRPSFCMQPIGFSSGWLIYACSLGGSFGPFPTALKLAVPLNSLKDSLICSLSYFSNISLILLSFLSNSGSYTFTSL